MIAKLGPKKKLSYDGLMRVMSRILDKYCCGLSFGWSAKYFMCLSTNVTSSSVLAEYIDLVLKHGSVVIFFKSSRIRSASSDARNFCRLSMVPMLNVCLCFFRFSNFSALVLSLGHRSVFLTYVSTKVDN